MPDTEDPRLTSWVEAANNRDTDFPIQNLPFGAFRRKEDSGTSIGIAIGDQILDLRKSANDGLLDNLSTSVLEACLEHSLNRLMALGAGHWRPLRQRVSDLLRQQSADIDHNRRRVAPMLSRMRDCEMGLPCAIGDYTDFYASVHHARNVGALFRPDSPLMPNYKHVPIGYHGRASSIVVSGTPIRRPSGQSKDPDAAAPSFGPSRALDYELEVGFFIGDGNALGQPVPLGNAESHIFGLCLMNDWSARDIQSWEYQPLGPFLSKNFGTTISPWLVSIDALAPFRTAAAPRSEDDPEVLPYLKSKENVERGGMDIALDIFLCSRKMREAGIEPVRLGASNLRELYWTPGQLVTHHTSTGCNLRPGDLIASGTVSGPTRDSLGCMLELTRRGKEPISLPTGEIRRFLEDGDEVIMRGYCQRPGFARIGFGECCGTIVGGDSR
jgi:fumarylacetoacetase